MSEQEFHSEWCRQMWSMMADLGTWGVPRSGLIFQKVAEKSKLVLINMMPHDPSMPMSAEELREYQRSDFNVIREQFAKIDVHVSTGKFDKDLSGC
jgi:hypothetical protein